MGIHDGMPWSNQSITISTSVCSWCRATLGVENWIQENFFTRSAIGRWSSAMMKEELGDLAGNRLRALKNIEKNKRRVARWYDKKVKGKEFTEGDLVWKLILPIGSRDPKYGKWSPNWEGPYRISQCVPGNAYILQTLEGEKFSRALNGKYLKKYYPSIGVDT
jgi:hypothetical protein